MTYTLRSNHVNILIVKQILQQIRPAPTSTVDGVLLPATKMCPDFS